MVKLQKPIPKKFKDKAKLDNPIKKQKDDLKKGKATKNITKKLVQAEVPIKIVETVTKSVNGKKSKVGKKSEKQQENLQTKPAVAMKAKELKTNGAVEVKAAKKSKLSNQNGSTKVPAALPLKASAQPTSVKNVKKVKEEAVKQVKDKKAIQKAAPTPKPTVPKETAAPKPKVSKEVPASKPSAPKVPKAKDIQAPKTAVAPKTKKADKKAVLVDEDTIPAAKAIQAPKTKKADKKAVLVDEDTTPAAKAIAPKTAVAPKTKKADKKAVLVEEDTTPAAKAIQAPKTAVAPKTKKADKKAVLVAEDTTAAANVTKPVRNFPKLHPKEIAVLKAELDPAVEEDEEKEEQNDDGKPKVKRERKVFRYEPFPYDEQKFDEIVTLENITKVAAALKTLVQKEIANKKTGIFDDFRYFLQVGCFKIPSCPKRMVKVFLRHPMVERGDDVLFIVPDLQRGSKIDYEPTKQHWEDLLRPIGMDWITVMPMSQLRKEYVTFEQKRSLCASYDHFLCDGRIVSHVVGLIGKLSQKPRMTLHAVRRNGPENLQRDIQSALCRTAYRQLCKSTTYSIPIATHKFTSEQVAENVVKVIRKLKKIFPGGMGNVRNFFLKIDIRGTSALPFYISMAKPPEETPYVVGPREKRMLLMKQEANEVLSKFAMTKEGKLIKLTKAGVEKKRKITELKAALKEEEKDQPKAKKAKKGEQQPEVKTAQEEEPKAKNAKKDASDTKKNQKQKQKEAEVKELELPENEEDDDETSDDDDDNEVQLAGSSDEEESEDMGQFDQEEDDDQESDVEILENGLADEDDEDSDDEQQEDGNTSGGDDDDEEEDDDDDGDEDDDEEDDESS